MTLVIKKPTSGKLVMAKGQPFAVDPIINNVSLLLHFNGANNSTSMLDSSPRTKTVTASGDAKISTAQSKFGGSSLALDGSGDYITVPANSELALAGVPFTVEAWIYIVALPIDAATIFHKWGAGNNGYRLDCDPSGRLLWYTQTSAKITSSSLTTGTWHYVAVAGSGSASTMYVNGTAVNANPVTDVFFDTITQSFQVGALNLGQFVYPFNGYVDELRITRGIARYSGSSFTVPTAPFPDI